MKKAILILSTFLSIVTLNAQDNFNPKSKNHELSFDTEIALTKTLSYGHSNPNSSSMILLNKTSEIGFGVNYKHKVIQKGNYFMHFGFNSGIQLYNHSIPFTSDLYFPSELNLTRNKFRMGFSKEFYLLKDKLILEPVINLTYLTLIYDEQRFNTNISVSDEQSEYNYQLALDSENLRRMYPQLQLNVNYQVFKRLSLGFTMKSGLFEQMPYAYHFTETIYDDQSLSSTTTENSGDLSLGTRNLYLGFNIAFKY